MSGPLLVEDRWKGLDDAEKQALRDRLAERLAGQGISQNSYPDPGTMALALDRRVVQRPHLQRIDEAFTEALSGEVDRILIVTPPQIGKLIGSSCQVPTPGGWAAHGDLKVGDLVLHPSGVPVAVTDVIPQDEPASWLVTTRSGAKIKTHAAHEWTVWDRHLHEWTTLETQELAYGRRPGRGRGWSRNTHTWGTKRIKLSTGPASGRGHRYRFQLPWQEALDLKHADLPVDPYTLGVWLGDGKTTDGVIIHQAGDYYDLPYKQGAQQTHVTTGVLSTCYLGLRTDLLALGVASKKSGRRTKHIPDPYLRASDAQRWDLLCGLVDTDGTIDPAGQITVSGCDRQLMEDVAELVRTFGYRVTWHIKEPCLSSSGIQGKRPLFVVQFTPHDGRWPCRLARKRKAIGARVRRRDAIVSVEPCEPEPGKCISVDSPDGLYLVGEQMVATHNSQRAAVWGPFWFLAHRPRSRVVVASYGSSLANARGRSVRGLVTTHGARFGLKLDPRTTAANDWMLSTGGGMRSVGVGGGLTGHAADVAIIDDPHKDRAEADSPTIRDGIAEWWSSTLISRLGPGAPAVLILTRWHPDDLAGRLLADEGRIEEGGRWRVVDLPALATDHSYYESGKRKCACVLDLHDPLGRKPGEPLSHPRIPEDDTDALLKHWLDKRRSSTVRDWAALYQADPVPAEGALLDFETLRRQRYYTDHPAPVRTSVALDPSGGGRDEVGLCAGFLGTDQRLYWTHDRSKAMKSDVWGREACLLAHEIQADRIVIERNFGGDQARTIVGLAWEALKQEGLVSGLKPRIVEVHAKKGKLLRAEPVAQAVIEDKIRLGFPLPDVETEWTTWQVGAFSPGRIDATAYLAYDLLPMAGSEALISSPAGHSRSAVQGTSALASVRVPRTRSAVPAGVTLSRRMGNLRVVPSPDS